ncbi:hypothetical protein M8J76_010656 [Diaphorina citri]|nr:hypothetical protein M8J76_010656 [Diaphorina citri]
MVKPSAKLLVLPYSIGVCFVYLVGIVNFLTNLEENKCDMTFMYEFPQYTDIPISPDIDRKYKQYSLSAYSEGILSEKVRRMKFTGIPVLFIPGHSGSGKQVRSIASVALRKSVDESHLQFHFDFFSVDFNGEYSALFGGVLDAQTRYVAHSLHKILTLYQPHRQPASVVIIGHSMGGMIAKGLYLLDGFDPSLISTIITLATPHEPVNRFWSTYNHENTSIVSIGGGNADIHVRASLTKTDHVDICTSSSMIPAVWVGADHKSMVWCKRLIKVLVRILFDSVDPHTKHISTNVHHRNSVLKYHLSERFGGKSYRMAQNLGSQIFSSEGQWLEFASLQDTLEYRVGVREPTHILIKVLPLSSNPQHEMIAIDTLNIPGDHWLYACSANEFDGTKKFCQVGENLSGEARFLPSIKGKHLRTYIPLSELRSNKHTHVLIKIPVCYEYFRVSYDIYRPSDRISHTSIFSLLPSLSPLRASPLLSLSQEKPQLIHTLVLDDMQYVWLAARVRMIPRCDPSQKYPQSVATVRVPWSNQNTRYVIWRNVSSHTFPVTLYDPKPKDLYDPKPKDIGEEEGVSITFELDPNCQYLVTLQLSYWDSVSAFIFSYTPMLLSHVAAILLFLLAYQLVELDSSGSCSMFHLALAHSGANPISVLMGVKVLTTLVWVVQYGAPFVLPQLSRLLPNLSPDTAQLYAQDLDALIIPGLLYSMALSCVVLTGAVGLMSIVLWGKTMNTLAINFLAKLLHGSTLYSEWTMKILEKIPGLVAALMLSIAYNTCGGLAFALGFFKTSLKIPSLVAALMLSIAYNTCGGLAFALGFCMCFLKLVLLYEDIFEKLLFLPLNVLRRYVINKLKRYRRSRLANNQSAIDSTGNNQSAIDSTRANNRSAIDNRALDQPAIGNTDGPIALRSTSNEPIALPSTSNDGPNTLPNTSNGSPIALLANPNDAAVNDQPMVPKVSGRLLVPTALERPVIVREDSPIDDEDEGVSFRDLNFHFTLFLLWLIPTLLSFPSTLVWAKTFGDTMQLSPDPISTYAVIMSLCAALLWQTELPKPNADYYLVVSNLVYLAGCYILLYAQTSLYRIIPAICFVFVVVCSHQLITSVFGLDKPQDEEWESEARGRDDSSRASGSLFTTSVSRQEELVRDMLDSQLNCLYKKVVRPFRDLVCTRRTAAETSGDEVTESMDGARRGTIQGENGSESVAEGERVIQDERGSEEVEGIPRRRGPRIAEDRRKDKNRGKGKKHELSNLGEVQNKEVVTESAAVVTEKSEVRESVVDKSPEISQRAESHRKVSNIPARSAISETKEPALEQDLGCPNNAKEIGKATHQEPRSATNFQSDEVVVKPRVLSEDSVSGVPVTIASSESKGPGKKRKLSDTFDDQDEPRYATKLLAGVSEIRENVPGLKDNLNKGLKDISNKEIAGTPLQDKAKGVDQRLNEPLRLPDTYPDENYTENVQQTFKSDSPDELVKIKGIADLEKRLETGESEQCDENSSEGKEETEGLRDKPKDPLLEPNTTGTKSSRNKRKRRNRKKKTNNVGNSDEADEDSEERNEANVENIKIDSTSACDRVLPNDKSEAANTSNVKVESDTREDFKSGKGCSLEEEFSEEPEVKKGLKGASGECDGSKPLVSPSSHLRVSTGDLQQLSDDASSSDSKQSSNDTNSSFCEIFHPEDNPSENED